MTVTQMDWDRLKERYEGRTLLFRSPPGYLTAYDQDAWDVTLALSSNVQPAPDNGEPFFEAVSTGFSPLIYYVDERLANERLAELQGRGLKMLILEAVPNCVGGVGWRWLVVARRDV